MASLNSASTLPSALTSSNSLQPPPPSQVNIMEDTSSIAMFTAVGHVGLHLVIRPLMRWGIRSFLMPSKTYIDQSANKSQTPILESETQIQSELEESASNLNNGSKSSSKLKPKKVKNLSDIGNGIAGPYSEIVCTFSTLAGISYTSHPQNVLLYFGITYPSMPFILRFWHTLNDKKSKITLARVARLTGKSMIVTCGFGVSMAVVGVLLQAIPFFNIFCLAFWDCFADFVLSDGPNK
eukprot:121925_1